MVAKPLDYNPLMSFSICNLFTFVFISSYVDSTSKCKPLDIMMDGCIYKYWYIGRPMLRATVICSCLHDTCAILIKMYIRLNLTSVTDQ